MTQTLASNLLIAIANVMDLLISSYTFLVAGAVIVSWVRADPYNPIVRFLTAVTEPVFSRIRRLLPRQLFKTGLDFTPLLVVLLLIFIRTFLVNTLLEWGLRLKHP